MSRTLEERVRIIEDREEIIRLRARYCNVNDGGWDGMPTHHDIDALVNMFTPDGVWDGGPRIGVRAEGHDQIRALFNHFRAVEFLIHNVMNPIIDIDGDTAHGDWHAIITSTAGSGPDRQAMWVLGKYEEDYLRTPEGWKIKYLRFVTAANPLYELGWGKAQFAGAPSARAAT